MKSALIYNDTEELRYAVVDGDWSAFQGIYVNDWSSQDPELTEALCDRLFTHGKVKIKFCHIDEFAQAIRDGAVVVECGFLF